MANKSIDFVVKIRYFSLWGKVNKDVFIVLYIKSIFEFYLSVILFKAINL